MLNLQQYLHDFQSGKGTGRRLAGWLFKDAVAGLHAAALDLRQQQEALETQKTALAALMQEVQQERSDLQTLRRDMESMGVNVRNNNARLDTLQSDNALCKVKLTGLERRSARVSASEHPAAVHMDEAGGGDYTEMDYFDFENHFRGSIESIRQRQRQYLPYFCEKKNVLDIGCGRGEFLGLMQEEGIPAKGVDLYPPYADFCRMQGLDVECGDGIAFLERMETSPDGIFAGQVAEHLKTPQIIRLCELAYEKLQPGGCILLETPNPTSLAIYTNAFYIDPSHVKPVHPLTMQYFLEKAGFTDITLLYPESSRPPFRIPALSLPGEENGEAFRQAMEHVSNVLFGSQDYAVIAVKA